MFLKKKKNERATTIKLRPSNDISHNRTQSGVIDQLSRLSAIPISRRKHGFKLKSRMGDDADCIRPKTETAKLKPKLTWSLSTAENNVPLYTKAVYMTNTTQQGAENSPVVVETKVVQVETYFFFKIS